MKISYELTKGEAEEMLAKLKQEDYPNDTKVKVKIIGNDAPKPSLPLYSIEQIIEMINVARKFKDLATAQTAVVEHSKRFICPRPMNVVEASSLVYTINK